MIATYGILAILGVYVYKEFADTTGDLISDISSFLSANKFVIVGIIALVAFLYYEKQRRSAEQSKLYFERQMALKHGDSFILS